MADLRLPTTEELARHSVCAMQELVSRVGVEAALDAFTPAELAALRFELDLWLTPTRRLPDPKIPPGFGLWAGQWPLPPGGWKFCLSIGGRASAKSTGAANWLLEQAEKNPNRQFAIVAPTLKVAWDVCVRSPMTGLMAWQRPHFKLDERTADEQLTCPNGTVIYLLSGKTPESIRDHGNLCKVWVEEPESMDRADEVFKMLDGSVRDGEQPQVVLTANPKKGLDLFNRLMVSKQACVLQSSALENPLLSEVYYLQSIRPKLGTTEAREFVFGLQSMDDPGALFRREWFEHVTPAQVAQAQFKRIGIAVDPAETSKKTADDTGIVAGAVDADGFGYLIADATAVVPKGQRKPSPGECAKRVVELYWDVGASFVTYDAARNGETFAELVRGAAREYAAKENDPKLSAVHVLLGRGGNKDKAALAYPVASKLYEKKKVRHVHGLELLENEMCEWTPAEKWSPNRMDAACAVLTELMLTAVVDAQAFRGGGRRSGF